MAYRLRINRGLCTGYAECVGIPPEVFALGKDSICFVLDPEAADDERGPDLARVAQDAG
jgi:ferredoxin